MAVPKHEYIMDYIPDKNLFKAVMWARNMINDGKQPGIAIRRASYRYKVDMKDVAHYVGQRGGRKNAEKRCVHETD